MKPDSRSTELRFAQIPGVSPTVPLAELRAHQPYHLGVVVKNTTNPAWLTGIKAAEDCAAQFGARVSCFAPEIPDDVDQQNALLQAIIDDGNYAGVLFAPADFTAQVPMVLNLNAAGIPIYNVGSRCAGGEIVTYVGGDDYAIGQDIVQWLAARCPEGASVIIIEGIRAGITGQDRMRGINDALGQHPGIRVLAAESASYDRGIARDITRALLTAHPETHAVIALNDEMAIGAAAAARALGRAEHLLITGVNGTPDGLRALQAGEIAASFDYAVYEMTTLTMELAIRHLNGEALPRQDFTLPAPIIDDTNIARAIERRRGWGVM